MWIALYFLAIIIILLWLISSPFYWKTKKIPYLLPLPIFGNFFPVFRIGNINFMLELYKKFPKNKFFGIHFLTRPTLFIKDPELIHRIFQKDFEHFTSHGMYSNQDRDPAGANLFIIYGDQWKEVRQKVSHYLTPLKIKSMLSCFENTLPEMTKIIDKNIENNTPMEMEKFFLLASTDISVQSIFGVKSDAYVNEKNSIFADIAYKMMKGKFSLRLSLSIIFPKLYDLFKLTIFEPDFNDILKDVVKDTIKLRKTKNIVRNDFLQGLIELLNTEPSSNSKYFPDNSRVPQYNLDTITSQAIIHYVGAVETTSLTLSFLFYELSKHPDIQKKCREEIYSIAPEGTDINLEDLNKLPYLNAVVKETLRLHSPFIMINRECTKTYKVPNSDLIIEKGTFIIISPIASHLQEENFPEPKKFMPERFLNENKEDKKPGIIYFPFGVGPRTCIGMNFGLLAVKVLAANLLQRYEFTICSKTQIPMEYSKFLFFTSPANGIWLNVRHIKN